MLTDEIMALKLSIAAKDGGLPLTQSSSSVVNYSDLDSESDVSSVKSESSDNDQVLDADDEREEPSQETVNPKVVKHTTSRKHYSKMTEGGFKLVVNSGEQSRIFTNSSLKPKHHVSQHGKNNTFCSVFVSNLTTNTKSADVVSFLHKKHNRNFKVVPIPSKFNDCVSFKVVVPVEMKETMLDKGNWTKNVYLCEFLENSRGLASLSAKY